jgi:hypothetical protein
MTTTATVHTREKASNINRMEHIWEWLVYSSGCRHIARQQYVIPHGSGLKSATEI